MRRTADIPQLASLADMREPVPVYIEQQIRRATLMLLDEQYDRRCAAIRDGHESNALAAALLHHHGRASEQTARIFGLVHVADRVRDETDRLVLLIDPRFNEHTDDRQTGRWRQTWIN